MKNTHKINKPVFIICSAFSALFACDGRKWSGWSEDPYGGETRATSSWSSASTAQSSTYKGKGKSKGKGKLMSPVALLPGVVSNYPVTEETGYKGKGKGKTIRQPKGKKQPKGTDPALSEGSLAFRQALVFDYSVPTGMPSIVDPELGEKAMQEALSALFDHIYVYGIFRDAPEEVDDLKSVLPDLIEGAIPPSKRVEYINQLLEVIKRKSSWVDAGMQLRMAKMDLSHQWGSDPIEEEMPDVISFKLVQKTVRKSISHSPSALRADFRKLPAILDQIKDEGTFDEIPNQLFILLAYSYCKQSYTPTKYLPLPTDPADQKIEYLKSEALKIELKQFADEVSAIWEVLKVQLFPEDTEHEESLRKRFEKDRKRTDGYYLKNIAPAHRDRFLQLLRELTPDDYVKNPHIFDI